MHSIRPPAVAGSFYPADPHLLQQSVDQLLERATSDPPSQAAPKALILPHAGYIYSGATAAHAFAQLQPFADHYRRVLLVGPSHQVGFNGIAVPGHSHFATPLGEVAVDQELREEVLRLDSVVALDAPHEFEHCLEVQIPFLQRVLESFSLLPMLAGKVTPDRLARVMDQLAHLEDLLILVSSDLSHYHGYDTARDMDLATAQAIEALEPEAIGYDQACGRVPLQGLLYHAQRHGLRPSRLDLRNSGDTAGPRDRVVGYGAWRFD